MNYIYDIFLNFNRKLYDFFDWNLNDNIVHIKKIPFFKVTTYNLKSIICGNIKLDDEFIDRIKFKTEIFNRCNHTNISYSCLVADRNKIIGIKLNKKGEIINYSSLLIDEEEEILDCMKGIKITNIKTVPSNKKIICNSFYTRKEQSIINYIKKQLKSIVRNNEYDKLRYLYFECFNKKEEDGCKIIKEFNNLLNKELTINLKKLDGLLRLTSNTN